MKVKFKMLTTPGILMRVSEDQRGRAGKKIVLASVERIISFLASTIKSTLQADSYLEKGITFLL